VAKFRQTLSDPDTRGLGATSTSGETAGVVGRGLQNLAALGEDVLDLAVSRKEAQASQALSAGMQEARSQDEALARAEALEIRQASLSLPSRDELFAGNDEEDTQAVLQAKTALTRIENARLSRTNKDLHQRAFLAAHMNNKFLDADDISRAARSITGGSNATDMYKELAETQSFNEKQITAFLESVEPGFTPEAWYKHQVNKAQAEQYEYSGGPQDEVNLSRMYSNDTIAFHADLNGIPAEDLTTDLQRAIISSLTAKLDTSLRQYEAGLTAVSASDARTKMVSAESRRNEIIKDAWAEMDRLRTMSREDREKVESARLENFYNNMSTDPLTREALRNSKLTPEDVGEMLTFIETHKAGSVKDLKAKLTEYVARLGKEGTTKEEIAAIEDQIATVDNVVRIFTRSMERYFQGFDKQPEKSKDQIFKLLVGGKSSDTQVDGLLRLRYMQALEGQEPLQHIAASALIETEYSTEISADTSGIIDSEGRVDVNAVISAMEDGGLFNLELTAQTKNYIKQKTADVVEALGVLEVNPILRDMDGTGRVKWKLGGAREFSVSSDQVQAQSDFSTVSVNRFMALERQQVGLTQLQQDMDTLNAFVYLLHRTGNDDLAEKIYEAVEQKGQNVEEVVEEQTNASTQENTETAEVVQYSDL
jgi:hypothetical protein